jgi:cyclopropane fatty-acyl-phospholipid synthase-like methyltransferase
MLEIGFGNGKLLKYLKDTGADIHGITISREQYDISKKMGLNVELINFFDMGEEYYGKYDSIICSGVIEHLPNIKTKKQLNVLYNKIFSKFSKLLDPNSKIKRIVTTCIHFRDISKTTSFWSKFNLYILERANGGWYPSNKDYLIDCAKPYFNLLYRKDITNDYYITTYHWAMRFVRKIYKFARPLLFNGIVNILNNPYYLHILIEKIYSWQWQFSDKNNSVIWDMITGLKKNMNVENSPTIHQLLVFKMK